VTTLQAVELGVLGPLQVRRDAAPVAITALNRHELLGTPDFVSIDHRRGRAFAPGGLPAYLRATWELTQQGMIYVEAVHRLTGMGAVVTQASYGTSKEGFDAEWREIALGTIDGGLVNRSELFDEVDIDAALARSTSCLRLGRSWKMRQAKWPSDSKRTSRRITGTLWRKPRPMTSQATIAVRSWAQAFDKVQKPI
jgi:hypothetical protein